MSMRKSKRTRDTHSRSKGGTPTQNIGMRSLWATLWFPTSYKTYSKAVHVSHFRSLRPGAGPRIKRNGSCIRAPEVNQTIEIRLLETKSRKMVRRHNAWSVSVWNAKCIQMWQLVFFHGFVVSNAGNNVRTYNSKDEHIWNYSETYFLRNAGWKNKRSGTHEIVIILNI